LSCVKEGEDVFYWFMLSISIIAEVIGTISIKFAGDDAGPIDYLLLFSLVASSYYFLSKAIQGIPLGLAYAIWEGLGLIMMLISGYLFFNERIYKEKFLACSIIIIGMVMLNNGRIKPSQKGE
jgi:multidrug transporter EmrE-like cation transporter